MSGVDGERVHVNVRLIRMEDRTQVWAGSFQEASDGATRGSAAAAKAISGHLGVGQ